MADINDVCDYVIHRIKCEGEDVLSNLRLQKLLYYCQSWNLAFTKGEPLFNGKFQAWVHGPVSREIYNRFKDTKSLYSEIEVSDIRNPNFSDALRVKEMRLIDNVLSTYLKYSDVQLELMTHREEPWMSARNGYSSTQRCEVEIDERLITTYYAARLK